MANDENFTPTLGRMGDDNSGKATRKFRHRVIAATNIARDGPSLQARRSGFTGIRIGRGCGVGTVLAARDRFAAFHQRRVIVRVRLINLRGAGMRRAADYLRYLERDGTTRDGGRGALYGADDDKIDRSAWLKQAAGDRHQFRIVVSAEDGLEYEDLKPLTRRLTTRVEEDLGTRCDWIAIDHYNTGHPHTHLVMRGKDDRGKDLIIAREYITSGICERACELVDLDLGPRSGAIIEQRLRAEVRMERLTSIDSALIRDAEADILTISNAQSAFDHAVRRGRLKRLGRMGLATQLDGSHWRLAPSLSTTLRQIGERGDAVQIFQRTYGTLESSPGLANLVIHQPFAPDARSVIGRVVQNALAEKTDDPRYLMIEATDGLSHYIRSGTDQESIPVGAIVRVSPAEHGIRQADHTIVEVAAANEGRYTIDAHLRHDPSASQADAEEHVRRLRAMQQLTHDIECEPDGAWIVRPNYLEQAADYEAARAKSCPILIDTLSSHPLEKLIEAETATWLDEELIAACPEPLGDAGFGRDLQLARVKRQQWLISEGLAQEHDGRIIYTPHMIATLQRRELLRVADRLSDELELDFAKMREGEKIEGRLSRMVELSNGRYALVEKAHKFTLVPWDPALDHQIGGPVAGIVQGDGVNWASGRQRLGPHIG